MSDGNSGSGIVANVLPPRARRRATLAVDSALSASLAFGATHVYASPPANDAYPGTEITSLPFTAMGSTAEATGESGEPDPGGISLAPGCSDASTPDASCLRSVWFSLPPGTGEYVTAETCESDYDTVLASYNTADPAPPPVSLCSPIVADDGYNTCEDNPSSSTLTFQSFAGTWRRIVIDGFQADSGNYVLHVYRGPNTSLQFFAADPLTGETPNPVTVSVGSSVPGTFECSLDGAPFAPCDAVLGPWRRATTASRRRPVLTN